MSLSACAYRYHAILNRMLAAALVNAEFVGVVLNSCGNLVAVRINYVVSYSLRVDVSAVNPFSGMSHVSVISLRSTLALTFAGASAMSVPT